MTVDPSADRPVYKQLADLVRAQIEREELAPGQRLPAENDYVQEYGISRDSVRRAIAQLRNEGLIVTARRGSHVRDRVELTTVRVESGRVRARMPTERERRELGIAEGVPVLIVDNDSQIYPADRTVIEVEKG